MAIVPTLSYSSVRTYLECPLRWKFLYVDRMPEAPRGYFSFGRSVHAVLEELLRPLVVPSARLTPRGQTQRTLDAWHEPLTPGNGSALMTPEELLLVYDRLWVREGYASAEEETRYRRLGQELLLAYLQTLQREPPAPVAVEEHLEARWDGIPVHGYIDRIDRTPRGVLEIVDYKTSRELSNEDVLESDQLSMYQVLVERNYSGPVEGLTLYHLRTQTPLRSPHRPADRLIQLYDRVGEVSDGIRSDAYEPSPGRHCSRCEFRAMCPEFKDVPTEERARLEQLVDRFATLRQEEGRLAQDLGGIAEALHREAERLGIHRMPGTRGVAIRRMEQEWRFAPEALASILKEAGLEDRMIDPDPKAIRRLLRNPSIDAEVRRRLAEVGSRQVKWSWEIEDATS